METRALSRCGLIVLAISGVAWAGVRPAGEGKTLQGEAALAHLQEQRLYASLAQAFSAARYQIRPAEKPGAGYTAQNPVQGLRTRFAREGLSLAYTRPQAGGLGDRAPGQKSRPAPQAHAGAGSRETQHARHPTHVRLTAVGRGERLTATTVTRICTEENRVDYTHRTAEGTTFTEWYVNAPTGLEHGFLLNDEVREMQDAPGPLALELALDTDLRPQLGDEQRLTLHDGSGKAVLAYEKLKVWDATGRVLKARMCLEPAGSGGSPPLTLNAQHPDEGAGYVLRDTYPTALASREPGAYTLQLTVDDAGATYPLTIDPTWTQQQQLTAGDGAAGDAFGTSVAIDGDTAVIGARNDDVGANANQGSAYVFTRSGGTWTQQAQLTAAGGAADDQFGAWVDVDDDTVVVGAGLDDVGANANQGSAYVFTRSGGIWTQQAQLTAADGAADDWFGNSVAVDGDTVVVGADLNDLGGSARGAAYVFTRSGTSWTQQARLTASDGAANDQFGNSVDVDADTVVVGAFADDVGVAGNRGSAYVFTRSGTSWTQQAQLLASDGAANDRFGNAVAVSGDTVVVGSYQDDVGAAGNQGSIYIFTRSGTSWTQEAQLLAANGAAGDQFGNSVAVEGDIAVVGAHQYDVGAAGNQGSAYIFTRSGTTWTQDPPLTATDGAANDRFGFSVAVSDSTVLVGAHLDDVVTVDRGSAYIFALLPDPPVISNVQVTSVAQTTATVTWTTDVSASSTVEYRTLGSIPYSTATGAAGTSHTVTLSGLTAGRTYEFRVLSVTDGGSAPGSQTTYPPAGHLQLLTAPNLTGEVLGLSLRRLAGTIYATVTYYNASGAAQGSVQLVSGELAGTSTVGTGTGLPVSLGTVPAGSAASTILAFSGGAGVSGSTAVITIGYASDGGGSTSSSYRVTLP